MSKKKPDPAPPPGHRCSGECVCRKCQGPTWYYQGKHVCRNASCGESFR